MADDIARYARHLEIIKQRSPATVSTYLDLLRRLDRELPEGLTFANADELIDAIYLPKRSPATKALYRAAVRDYFGWACDPEEGFLDFDPSVYLPPVRVPRRTPRPVSGAQLARILGHAGEPERTWFILAAAAGLRCVEISALDREHVTRETVWVHGKGGKERTVPTHPAVWTAVSPLPAGPVARMSGGERASRLQVRDRGNRVLQKRLRLEGVSMHRLRHYAITTWYRSHGEFVAQQLAGHASPATTANYALVASEALVAAVAALPMPGVSGGAAGAVAA